MNFSKRKDKPMNKILSIIVVFVVSLSLAGVAAALPPRAPTTICFSTVENEFGSEFSLLIKPMGNIKMSGGPVKFYSIQGVYFDPTNGAAAVSGSGYMDGSVFHFSLNGTYTFEDKAGFIQADGYWDVATKSGPIYTYWNSTIRFNWSLVEVSCTGQ
jgi:hypothetical protein